MKLLIIDVPNLFYRTVSAHSNKYGGTAEDKAGLALHSCLIGMNKWYNTIKPDQLAVVFEGNKNWRKSYTASNDCKSKVLYKGNRVKDPSMEHLYEVINDFEKLAREHTSIVCLSAPELEGDDLIAGVVQKYSTNGDEVVILSGDKDFKQLLKHSKVSLINPDDGKPRQCDDPEFFMFEKAIRGDTGDNVRSAFPRVRVTRLEKAFKDPYEMTLLMNETFQGIDPVTQEPKEFIVRELFEENNLLMNLEKQPSEIRQIIDETIEHGFNTHGKFSLFAFTKFLGQHGLKQIGDNSQKFVNLLSCRPTSSTQSTISTSGKRGILTF
jgi:hypothetical protein